MHSLCSLCKTEMAIPSPSIHWLCCHHLILARPFLFTPPRPLTARLQATVVSLAGMSASPTILIATCSKWRSWAVMEHSLVLIGYPRGKSVHCIAVIIFKSEESVSDSYFPMSPLAKRVRTVLRSNCLRKRRPIGAQSMPSMRSMIQTSLSVTARAGSLLPR